MKDSDDATKKNAVSGNEGELNDKDLDGVAGGAIPGGPVIYECGNPKCRNYKTQFYFFKMSQHICPGCHQQLNLYHEFR